MKVPVGHRVALTPVGRRRREDLQQAVDLLHAALARARAAAPGPGRTLRVGVFGHAGHELRPLVEALSAHHPGSDIAFGEVNGCDPFNALRNGYHEPTCCGCRSPNPTSSSAPPSSPPDGSWRSPPATRSPSAAMPRWRTSPTTNSPTSAPTHPTTGSTSWCRCATPLGRRVPRGPLARTFAAGRCVHPLGEIAARYNRPPGIVFLPVHDAPVLRFALTWHSANEDPALHALARTAAGLGPIPLTPRRRGAGRCARGHGCRRARAAASAAARVP
ncbi:hypothetical protein [Streptomyces sp. NPDC002825]|uniref:hypothetical protein n=1 Tax=Streptomyces sp. NPDC002825 TaxID=3154666 RepID=UPI00331ED532